MHKRVESCYDKLTLIFYEYTTITNLNISMEYTIITNLNISMEYTTIIIVRGTQG